MPAPVADATAQVDVLIVMHKGPSGRWQKVGTVVGFRAALQLVTGSGDWWLKLACAKPESETGPGLFDDVPAEEAR